MLNCNIDHSDYKNNGLITKIWGGPGWIFNHAVTFGYPINPTPEQKTQYYTYFTVLGNVLPCRYCRESYIKFITEGDTALTDNVLSSRDTLTKWFYDIHERVNDKLEVDYGVTYSETVAKYESFRAKCGKPDKEVKGCIAPLDYKAFSFKKFYEMDAPIIPHTLVDPFINIASSRGLVSEFFTFNELAKILNYDIVKIKSLDCWVLRNKYCQYQIRYMRENAIPSIETSGEWAGTPTIDELKLIMFYSSNLNFSELEKSKLVAIKIDL